MSQQINLGDLPAPSIIETLDYEQIVSQLKQTIINQNPDYADALTLESDPMVIAIQAFAYRELLLRQQINEAVRSNLLAFASNSDLDQLGAFYGVTRHTDEPDETFRSRIKDRILGSSTAGGEAHYRYQAFSVSPDIRDVAVDSPEPGVVRVSVLAKTGVDSAALVEQVKHRVSSNDVQVLTDTLEVVPSELIAVDISANITPLSGGLPISKQLLIDNFNQTIEQQRRLGWDLSPSWIVSQLHGNNIQQVELLTPSENIVITPNQCVDVRSIELNLMPANA